MPTDYIAELVHKPDDAAREHVEWAEKLRDAPGVTFGIPEIDNDMIPMHPGDMVVMVARPSHCKTSLSAYLAVREAKQIVKRKKQNKEIVLYISWEQITEEIDSYFHINPDYSSTDIVKGNVNIDLVRANAYKRVRLPVWLMGDSLSRSHAKTPRMTMDVIWQTVTQIKEEFGVEIALMIFDYLQLMPIPRGSDIVTNVTNASGMIKELAKRCHCPAFVPVQARQEVDDYDFKLPKSRDAQWASRIFQTCDKWLGGWRPWITDKDKGSIPISGVSYPIQENLFVLQKLKERWNRGVKTWALYFEPEWLKLASLESEIKEPNYY